MLAVDPGDQSLGDALAAHSEGADPAGDLETTGPGDLVLPQLPYDGFAEDLEELLPAFLFDGTPGIAYDAATVKTGSSSIAARGEDDSERHSEDQDDLLCASLLLLVAQYRDLDVEAEEADHAFCRLLRGKIQAYGPAVSEGGRVRKLQVEYVQKLLQRKRSAALLRKTIEEQEEVKIALKTACERVVAETRRALAGAGAAGGSGGGGARR
eukprot:g11561.t1